MWSKMILLQFHLVRPPCPQDSDVTEQLQGFLNWFLWPLKCKNHWSRLCVGADKDINPSMHTLQICCPQNKGFFLPDSFTASVHDIIPSEGPQLLQQWSCFFQTLGCHSLDMVAVSHPIRFCGWAMALVTDRHTLGWKLDRTGCVKAKKIKWTKIQLF